METHDKVKRLLAQLRDSIDLLEHYDYHLSQGNTTMASEAEDACASVVRKINQSGGESR